MCVLYKRSHSSLLAFFRNHIQAHSPRWSFTTTRSTKGPPHKRIVKKRSSAEYELGYLLTCFVIEKFYFRHQYVLLKAEFSVIRNQFVRSRCLQVCYKTVSIVVQEYIIICIIIWYRQGSRLHAIFMANTYLVWYFYDTNIMYIRTDFYQKKILAFKC